MRIAIIDEKADALGAALASKDAGHEVTHVSCVSAFNRAGLGLVSKAPTYAAVFSANKNIDLFAYFCHGMAPQAQALRAIGKTVIGGNAWIERLDHDRNCAETTIEACGLKTPKSVVFQSADEAINLIRSDPRKYVVKCGNGREFCSDVQAMLESHIRRAPVGPYRVSEYIHGVELYAETWYLNGVNQFTMGCLENRHFLDGDMGPQVEPQTSLSWFYSMREPRIYQSVLKKLEVLVQNQKFTGAIGVRVIISERDKKPYILGFRVGSYRHLHAARAACGFDLASFVECAAMPNHRGLIYTLAVSVPPYPAPVGAQAARGLSVIFPRNDTTAAVVPHDVERDPARDAGECVSGVDAMVADCVGLANTVDEARREAVRLCDGILVEGKQARRGGGATRLGRDLMRLKLLGYEVPGRLAKEAVS